MFFVLELCLKANGCWHCQTAKEFAWLDSSLAGQRSPVNHLGVYSSQSKSPLVQVKLKCFLFVLYCTIFKFFPASLPQVFFPCVMATDRVTGNRVFGADALKPEIRSNSVLSYPIRPKVKLDKVWLKSYFWRNTKLQQGHVYITSSVE